MARLDRYLLAQLTGRFGFFALVLVAIYWVNRSVLLFEQLISDGQTALVVLEFTALTLPFVIRVVLPLAAFAATLHAVSRLTQESEMVVMQAAGASPWRLARPAALFGLFVALLMAVLVHALEPVSRARLALRQEEVSRNLAAQFLTEGQFLHPAEGVTLYIREISAAGELLDLFLSDRRRSPAMIYTAERALIARDPQGPRLVMFSGMAQARDGERRLALTRFESFAYDIGALVPASADSAPGLRERSTLALLREPAPEAAAGAATPPAPDSAGAPDSPAARRAEIHKRLAAPLDALVAVLLGMAALLAAPFSRFGMARQIGLAIVALVAEQAVSNWAAARMQGAEGAWPLAYLAPALGLAAAAALLARAAGARRLPRAAAPAAPPATDPAAGPAEGGQ